MSKTLRTFRKIDSRDNAGGESQEGIAREELGTRMDAAFGGTNPVTSIQSNWRDFVYVVEHRLLVSEW